MSKNVNADLFKNANPQPHKSTNHLYFGPIERQSEEYPTLPGASCGRPGRDLAPKTFQGCSFIHLLILEGFGTNLGRSFEDLSRFTLKMRTDLTWIFNDVRHRFGVILDKILALFFNISYKTVVKSHNQTNL